MASTGKSRVPPFLRRRLIIMILACIAAGPLVIVVSKFGKDRLLNKWVYVLAVAIPGSASGVVAWWFGSALEKAHRRAKELNGRMCWRCGYSLEGIAADGACPECGRSYTRSELQERWDVRAS